MYKMCSKNINLFIDNLLKNNDEVKIAFENVYTLCINF